MKLPPRPSCSLGSLAVATPSMQRRILVVVISKICLKPCLKVSDYGLHFSGICTSINFLLPPSSLFISRTACPVVPEPAKKSRIMLWDLWLVVKWRRCFISSIGFTVSNNFSLNKALNSFVPFAELPYLSKRLLYAVLVSLPSYFFA